MGDLAPCKLETASKILKSKLLNNFETFQFGSPLYHFAFEIFKTFNKEFYTKKNIFSDSYEDYTKALFDKDTTKTIKISPHVVNNFIPYKKVENGNLLVYILDIFDKDGPKKSHGEKVIDSFKEYFGKGLSPEKVEFKNKV